jgi:hypothetical protein
MKVFTLILLSLTLTINLSAQKKADDFPGKPITWAFPKQGMETKEVAGDTFYVISKDILARKMEVSGLIVGVVLFAPNIAALAERAHLQDPSGLPDIDKFLTAVAVEKAIETPNDYLNQYLGKGVVSERLYYFYKTKSGVNVGATINEERTLIMIMPVPTVK